MNKRRPVNELTGAIFKPPWHATGLGQAEKLAEELNREVSSSHVLAGCRVVAVAKRQDCDDVLFRIEGRSQRYAVVHLTYRGKRETSPEWPGTILFDSLDEFLEKRMGPDSLDFEPGE